MPIAIIIWMNGMKPAPPVSADIGPTTGEALVPRKPSPASAHALTRNLAATKKVRIGLGRVSQLVQPLLRIQDLGEPDPEIVFNDDDFATIHGPPVHHNIHWLAGGLVDLHDRPRAQLDDVLYEHLHSPQLHADFQRDVHQDAESLAFGCRVYPYRTGGGIEGWKSFFLGLLFHWKIEECVSRLVIDQPDRAAIRLFEAQGDLRADQVHRLLDVGREAENLEADAQVGCDDGLAADRPDRYTDSLDDRFKERSQR